MSIADEALSRLGQLDKNRIAEIIGAVQDPELRKRLTEVIGKTMLARQQLGQIDIKPFEASHFDIEGLEIWKRLAPQFGEALQTIHSTIDVLAAMVPAPEEVEITDDSLDMAFAEDDISLEMDHYEPPLDGVGQQLDTIIDSSENPSVQLNEQERILERLADTSWAISSMLRDEMLRFGQRMRQATIVMDRWNLLAEVQETRHKLIKGLDALALGVCNSFERVKRDEVIPGFHSELAASLELRALIFDLRDEIRSVRTRMDQCPKEQWQALAQEVFDKMEHFVFGPVFGWLRALDKREVIQFRKKLREVLNNEHTRPRQYLEVVEGTVRFLEALEVINRREILVEHDRSALETARDDLQKVVGGQPNRAQFMASALAALSNVTGRDVVLDEMVESALDPMAEIKPQAILDRIHLLLATL